MDDLSTGQGLTVEDHAAPSSPDCTDSARCARKGRFLSSVLDGVVRAHRDAPACARLPKVDITECCALLIEATPRQAISHFERLLDEGLSPATLFESVFCRISIEMGESWACDRASFVDVTLAYSNLQMVLHHFRPLYLAGTGIPGRGRVLLATLPRETHVFGMLLFAARLERAGFAPTCVSASSNGELLESLEDDKFLAIGLSCGANTRVSDLDLTVSALFKVGAALPIIVGGGATSRFSASSLSHSVALWGASLEQVIDFLDARREGQSRM